MEDRQKAGYFEIITELCGYVENGTDTVVTLFQDDATKEWVVRVGKRAFYGRSLTEALTQAAEDMLQLQADV